MEKKFKIGIIGAGFMASAIIDGIIKSKILPAECIINSDKSDLALQKSASKGVNVTSDNLFLANNSEFILFAIKPQSLNDVLDEIKGANCNKFISIMAGVKRQKIKNVFQNSMVARCMPNTPCSISSGAIGADLTDFIDEDDISFIKNIFKSLAKVVLVKEDKLNAVTGVSGSSPAYFYMFIKGIVDAGIKHGLTYEEALDLAVSTMKGSAEMIFKNKDKSLEELINAVCSKGGTTIEAVKVFEENNLYKTIDSAIDACIKRSYELENL